MRDIHWGRVIVLGLSGLLSAALLVGFLPRGHWGMMGSGHHWGMESTWLGPWGWLFMALGWLIPLGLLGLLALCLIGLAREVLPGRTPPVAPALDSGPCPACGHPTQTDWHSCPYCGRILRPPAGEPSRQPKQLEEERT